MSEQTVAPLLWTDEQINDCIKGVLLAQPNHTPRGLVRRVSYAVRDSYEADRAQAAARIAELEAIIAYIDEHAPLADSTCIEPGITLSQAAERAIADERKDSE